MCLLSSLRRDLKNVSNCDFRFAQDANKKLTISIWPQTTLIEWSELLHTHVKPLDSYWMMTSDSFLRNFRRSSLTDALSSAGTGTEALIADAAVTAHRVLAAAVLTDAWFGRAFVQICAQTHVSGVWVLQRVPVKIRTWGAHPRSCLRWAVWCIPASRCTCTCRSDSYRSSLWTHSRPAPPRTRSDLMNTSGTRSVQTWWCVFVTLKESSLPLHIRRSSLSTYPAGHLHSYDPTVLTQRNAHSRGFWEHSLISKNTWHVFIKHVSQTLCRGKWSKTSLIILVILY